MTHPRWVNTATYAEAAGVTERTVRERIARGEIKATRKSERAQYRIPWSEYEHVAPPAPQPPSGRERPRKERAVMAAIRGAWTFVLPGLGFAITWGVDNIISLGLWSLPVSLAFGSFLYALKRYLFPDSTF